MKRRSEIESFNNAIRGIINAVVSEPHMKFHLFTAIIVLTLSLIVDITKYEVMLIIMMIAMVITAELLNSAVEKIVDWISPEYSLMAKYIKDVAAGAVLVSAIASLAIGYLIFYDNLIALYFNGDNFIKLFGRIGNITIIILGIVSILVIIIKAHFNKGTALEGGMPSGHSALAFSIFAIVIYMTNNIRIDVLVFLMALLVAQSRVKSKIHTLKEVFWGGVLGFTVSSLMMYMLVYFDIIILN